MTTVWTAIAATACLVSFLVGRHYSSFSADTIEELEAFTDQMTPLLANHEATTKEHLDLLIATLRDLDAGNEASAQKGLIEPLGRFYYNYTYENERYRNSESTESLLKTMESLADTSESFSSIVTFKPEE